MKKGKIFKTLAVVGACMCAPFVLSGCDKNVESRVSFRVEDGYIQVTEDGTNWKNLIDVNDLKGLPGQEGVAGKQVEFQATKTHIQWRYIGDATWKDLVSFVDLEQNKDEETKKNISKLKLIGIEMCVWAESGNESLGKTYTFSNGIGLYQDKRIQDKDYLFEDDVIRIWGVDYSEWSFEVTTEKEKQYKRISINSENDIIVPESEIVVLQNRGFNGTGEGLQYVINLNQLTKLNNDFYTNLYQYENQLHTWDGEVYDMRLIFEAEYNI